MQCRCWRLGSLFAWVKCLFLGRHCSNLQTLVITGGANLSNGGLKYVADGCTQLTVRFAHIHSRTFTADNPVQTCCSDAVQMFATSTIPRSFCRWCVSARLRSALSSSSLSIVHRCRLSATEIFRSPLLLVSGTNCHATSRLHRSLREFSVGRLKTPLFNRSYLTLDQFPNDKKTLNQCLKTNVLCHMQRRESRAV